MATLTTLPFDYEHAGLEFEGVLVSGALPNAPTVLVFHGMEGRSEAQVDFCHRLADAGYRAVAVDLFGRAVTTAGADACAAAMDGFLNDRNALRDRLQRLARQNQHRAEYGRRLVNRLRYDDHGHR